MAPTSLTLFASLLAFGTTVLAAPVAKPQSGATFTLGDPETTVTFEPGFVPPRDSPEYPRWLWYYWLNKYKEESEDDDFGDASSTMSWSKRGEPIKGGLPLCTAVEKGVACIGNPTTTVTVTSPEPDEPEEPEEPEWPEWPEWPEPEPEPPKGYPKPPKPTKKPSPPPKYPPKPEPPKWPEPPKYPSKPEPPKYPPYDEPEEPSPGITTSTYCTDAKKGITWDC